MKSTFARRFLAVSLLSALAATVHAAPRTWDGGGLTGFFSDPLNWDGNMTAPISSTDTLLIGANTISASPFIGLDSGDFRTDSFTFLASATVPYTVTSNTTGDILTLTGTGTALLNSSNVRHNFTLTTTVVGATTQTWDGGTQGLVLSGIDLGNNRMLTITGSGTTAATRNEISGGLTGTGTYGLTKSGLGTLLLNATAPNTYTGATSIIGGRLLLGSANQIPDSSKLVLSGNGTFDTGGFSDTIGALSLGGGATIDLGLSDALALVFADSHSELWSAGILNILNFTPGGDSLRFGINASGLTAAQVSQIVFNGSTPAMINSNGFLQPIPEPGVAAALFAGVALLASLRRRQPRSTTA